jgi:hypothetical protein
MFQVIENDLSNLKLQGELLDSAVLCAPHNEGLIEPIKVIDRQVHYLAGPQGIYRT